MAEHTGFSLRLERITGYEFETRFDWNQVEPLLLDEPEPLGGSKGPNA
ncbi:MAG: OsmC family peroxiredoxin, partial [Gemmatimonadales bacterium]|nr:OsmC family peroxiredoxin [Gemmatimonadales bacterium]